MHTLAPALIGAVLFTAACARPLEMELTLSHTIHFRTAEQPSTVLAFADVHREESFEGLAVRVNDEDVEVTGGTRPGEWGFSLGMGGSDAGFTQSKYLEPRAYFAGWSDNGTLRLEEGAVIVARVDELEARAELSGIDVLGIEDLSRNGFLYPPCAEIECQAQAYIYVDDSAFRTLGTGLIELPVEQSGARFAISDRSDVPGTLEVAIQGPIPFAACEGFVSCDATFAAQFGDDP